MTNFEVAVLGLGSMGSFACLDLARRKIAVIGIDPHDPPHARGSHTGDTRVFRIAYAEHPDYVPIAQRAGALWDQLGTEFGTKLLHRTGMLTIGTGAEPLLTGLQESARIHGLTVDKLSASEIGTRFPAFHLEDSQAGFFEASAGWVDVNPSIRLALETAERLGARLRRNCWVSGLRRNGHGVTITTAEGEVSAERVVIAAGAGSVQLLAGLGLPLSVQRKVLAWFDPIQAPEFSETRFPVFAAAPDFLYGFPNISGQGVKVGIHWSRGESIADPHAPVRPPTAEDWIPVLESASRILPGLGGPWPGDPSRFLRATTCLYVMTPDEHFIVERHPELENVYFAAGFSGHGFKFAPAIGEALVELATEGQSRLPIGFMRLAGRFR